MNEIVIDNKKFSLRVIKGTSKKHTEYYALVLSNPDGLKKYVTFDVVDIAQFVGLNLFDLVRQLG